MFAYLFLTDVLFSFMDKTGISEYNNGVLVSYRNARICSFTNAAVLLQLPEKQYIPLLK